MSAANLTRTGGEGANALVCKTSIRRFKSGPVLQILPLYPFWITISASCPPLTGCTAT